MQFETKESAIKAANDLNHVKFDERVVETDFMVLLLDVLDGMWVYPTAGPS